MKRADPKTDAAKIVAPFTIVVDTREQAPFAFDRVTARENGRTVSVCVPTERGTLATGDYSIRGHESEVAIERKSMVDLFACVGQCRERFEQELERMAGIPAGHLMLEFGLPDIFEQPPVRSLVKPRSVTGSLLAWSARYGMHVWFAGRRRAAEWLTFQILERWWKEKIDPECTTKRPSGDLFLRLERKLEMKITTTGRTPERNDALEQTLKRFDATVRSMINKLNAYQATLNAALKEQREAIDLHGKLLNEHEKLLTGNSQVCRPLGELIHPVPRRLKELQASQAGVLAEMESMLARCEADSRQLGAGEGNGEEIKTYAALEARAKENQSGIEKELEQHEREKLLATIHLGLLPGAQRSSGP